MCKRNTNQLPLAHPQLDTWPATQICALTGNQPFGSQASSQSTEPHQSRLLFGFFVFLKMLFLFRERGREREREGEKHQCVVVARVPHPGDLAHNPGMCPDWESNPLVCRLVLNPLSHTSQGYSLVSKKKKRKF